MYLDYVLINLLKLYYMIINYINIIKDGIQLILDKKKKW